MRFDKKSRRTFCRAFVFVVRLSLGCIFLYSSIAKMRQPYDFLSDVYGFEMSGPKLGMLLAMVLPWLELFVGICLIGGIFVSGALLASIAMGAMFTFAISSALYRGLNITCGCFGSSSGVISYLTLVRSGLILVAAVVAYLLVIFVPARAEVPARE
jgi:uncharacterized membrane protein YphA (DoxX/SURF4 family)